jgi:hypothetical protein
MISETPVPFGEMAQIQFPWSNSNAPDAINNGNGPVSGTILGTGIIIVK